MTLPDSARCFVAVGFSPATRAGLAALRPLPAAGVWPEAPENLHLTLHFLGTRRLGPVAEALAQVRAAPFVLRLRSLGSFRGREDHVLWAGVDGGPALAALHGAVADALGPLGFRPEDRPWKPHVTLGRARAAIPAPFLAQPPPDLAERVADFGLYTSRSVPGGVAYERVAAIPLVG